VLSESTSSRLQFQEAAYVGRVPREAAKRSVGMIYQTERLYEQAKTILRKQFPDQQFILACHLCGDTWPTKTEMGMVETHFEISHPEDAGNIKLDLVWIGEGKPPESRSE
jgi:hypothetical protein